MGCVWLAVRALWPLRNGSTDHRLTSFGQESDRELGFLGDGDCPLFSLAYGPLVDSQHIGHLLLRSQRLP